MINDISNSSRDQDMKQYKLKFIRTKKELG